MKTSILYSNQILFRQIKHAYFRLKADFYAKLEERKGSERIVTSSIVDNNVLPVTGTLIITIYNYNDTAEEFQNG